MTRERKELGKVRQVSDLSSSNPSIYLAVRSYATFYTQLEIKSSGRLIAHLPQAGSKTCYVRITSDLYDHDVP